MKLDITAITKASASLEEAVARSKKEKDDAIVRDAVIQRFEYSYELAWKMMRRQLEVDSENPEQIDQMSYRELLRDAAEKGLLAEVDQWVIFRQQRNISSHTYNEDKAISVYGTAVQFVEALQKLVTVLEQKNK
ncbi:MAG: nucleotidyltransferase substrate binding protein [Coxiellaceae bacterium]|nr:nucleotidyltransferase substrate binding protein [Coxiellaceae bacterium]